MLICRKISAFILATSLSLSACVAEPGGLSADQMPPKPLPTPVGTASGKGVLEQTIWTKDPSVPPEKKKIDFAPKFSYAYPEMKGEEKNYVVVFSEQSPDITVLDAADDRNIALQQWCKKKQSAYVTFVLDTTGKPDRSASCSADGSLSIAHVNVTNDLASIKVDLTVNDGKRLEGNIGTGVGSKSTGDGPSSWVETTGDYTFAATLASPRLRDRVLAEGSDKGAGVSAAKTAFQDYWKHAGIAKSLSEIEPLFTPERRAKIAFQLENTPESFKQNMIKRLVEAHSAPTKITSAKSWGAAAVIDSESEAKEGKNTMACRTLLLNVEGGWKVGDESCSYKKNEVKR